MTNAEIQVGEYVRTNNASIFKDSLFQFIKERRRILNRGVVEMIIPQYAYIKYLIMTTCEIPKAREEILRYIEELLK